MISNKGPSRTEPGKERPTLRASTLQPIEGAWPGPHPPPRAASTPRTRPNNSFEPTRTPLAVCTDSNSKKGETMGRGKGSTCPVASPAPPGPLTATVAASTPAACSLVSVRASACSDARCGKVWSARRVLIYGIPTQIYNADSDKQSLLRPVVSYHRRCRLVIFRHYFWSLFSHEKRPCE